MKIMELYTVLQMKIMTIHLFTKVWTRIHLQHHQFTKVYRTTSLPPRNQYQNRNKAMQKTLENPVYPQTLCIVSLRSLTSNKEIHQRQYIMYWKGQILDMILQGTFRTLFTMCWMGLMQDRHMKPQMLVFNRIHCIMCLRCLNPNKNIRNHFIMCLKVQVLKMPLPDSMAPLMVQPVSPYIMFLMGQIQVVQNMLLPIDPCLLMVTTTQPMSRPLNLVHHMHWWTALGLRENLCMSPWKGLIGKMCMSPFTKRGNEWYQGCGPWVENKVNRSWLLFRGLGALHWN